MFRLILNKLVDLLWWCALVIAFAATVQELSGAQNLSIFNFVILVAGGIVLIWKSFSFVRLMRDFSDLLKHWNAPQRSADQPVKLTRDELAEMYLEGFITHDPLVAIYKFNTLAALRENFKEYCT